MCQRCLRVSRSAGWTLEIYCGNSPRNRNTTLSQTAQEEIRELARSESFKNDMVAVAGSRHNPFIHKGVVDVDASIQFVTAFNEFINHEPKPFTPISDRNMRLEDGETVHNAFFDRGFKEE